MVKEYIRGGSVHKSGTSVAYKTGGWRVFKPIIDQSKCNYCKLCYWYCPDNCIIWEKDNIDIDFEYCKGCGICAYECPKHAIEMKREKP
ncbi:MAG: 4Fe-4S binding protein [Pseudomonadota bacterium]